MARELLTVWVITLDVEVKKFVSLPYTAVIECVPTPAYPIWHVATPKLSVVEPPVQTMVDVPSLNVTVPVGVPAPGLSAITVAVYVTDCPTTDGFTNDVRAVLVPAWLITWVIALEVEVKKFVSPGYSAVIE
jgi:hypothetical protein